MTAVGATYGFLPWLRRGLASRIARKDGEMTGEPRADVAITIELSAAGEPRGVPVPAALYGPGEVGAIDGRVVIRTTPRAGEHDAEPNYFVAVEFAQADFPWRYTPARADAQGRLRPWLVLAVVMRNETVDEAPPSAGRLPALTIADASALPRLSQSWAWGHTQIEAFDASQETASAIVREQPHRVRARLLAPRRLQPNTAYRALLVPAFERGRRAGLGETLDDTIDGLAPAWADGAVSIRLPVYYETTWNIWGFHGLNLQTFEEPRNSIGRELLQTLGVPSWDPRVLRLNFAERAYDFSGPFIEDRPPSEIERLAFNYIAWLRTASIADLQKQGAPPADPAVNALLYLMLRHALLSEYDASAKQILQWQGMLAANELREAELLHVVPPGEGRPVQRTAWDRLSMAVSGVTGDRTLGEVITDPPPVTPTTPPPLQQAFGDVAAYRGALERLENLPTAELHRLFGETLDLTSHRLDAWLVGGLFDERLREMRANNPTGLYIGCYGWVENLRPDPPLPRVPIRAPDGAPAEARTDSDGYVLAPSMLQAAVAAVLRSAYPLRSGQARDAYAIDPSSHRVRTALWLVDTVRAEQPLGAALGYRFERGLHEGHHPGVELDQFIDELRELYPLTGNKAEDSGKPAESVAARNVVDGLRLHKAWRENKIPFGVGGRLVMDAAERAAVDAELRALDDAIDAVSDLMTAEAVYQVLKGSAAGAAAALDTLAKGTRPPDIEVATTPRSGKALHQRYILALRGGDPPAEWAAVPSSPRAAAAPELNAWLARKFGSPCAIACVVTPKGAPAREVTVADLGLQAIDLFLLARTAETEGGASDIDRSVAWHVAGPAGPDVSIAIDYDAAISSDAVTFAQAFEIASAIGREGTPPQAGDAWSGLLLDAWPELAPNIEEDAGVAFHYDAPRAQAPQAVLLAVTPPGRPWSFELLEQTLFQALDLARMRTVDLETLGPLGQLLPMSFLTANPKNATVSTSFAGLTVADATITLKS